MYMINRRAYITDPPRKFLELGASNQVIIVLNSDYRTAYAAFGTTRNISDLPLQEKYSGTPIKPVWSYSSTRCKSTHPKFR